VLILFLMKILLGQKIGMTQLWDDKGKLVAATVIRGYPNKVLRYGEDRVFVAANVPGKVKKPQQKIAKEAGITDGMWLKSIDQVDRDTLDVTQFAIGDLVTVTGITKGKGFAGTIKRHGFHRGPMTHGSNSQRRPGSIGAQRPQRVPKGQKMAGHLGNVQFTSRGNRVISVEPAENLLVVTGAIPGPKKSRVIVRLQENQ
jgi:large subunit ribosomal protein L3